MEPKITSPLQRTTFTYEDLRRLAEMFDAPASPTPNIKRKRGRPRKDGGRIITIQIRLTQTEDARLDREAAALRVGKSELVRSKLFRRDELDENIRIARLRTEEIATRMVVVERLLAAAANRDSDTNRYAEATHDLAKDLIESGRETSEKMSILSTMATRSDIEKLGPPLLKIATASENISRNLGNGR